MIAIKDMPMPKNCGDCFIQERNACPVAHRWASEDIDRPLWCPLVETIEPKHGHWIDKQNGRWIYAECSRCKTVHDVKSNYCPNCGAKMDEVEE